LIRAILGAVACLWVSFGTADAAPALWVVKSGDSTVYLFGTIHVVKSGVAWETPTIHKALAESQDLWLEEIDDDPATAQPLIASLGIDRAHPLSSKLSPADLGRVDAAAKAAGLAGGEAALEPMRPWLAAVSLAVVPIVQAGYDPKLGVDKALEAEAQAAHKPVHGFETLEQQMHFFGDLPQAVEVQFLQSTLDEVAEGPAKVDELFAAWSSGDTAALDRLFSDLAQEKYRDLYDVLIVQRNRAWADQIAGWLRSGKATIFVAVGAGHFTGSDSLQNLLEQRGLHVTRQ
jgi:uncharacterized protein YbaP (TraB family)